MKYRNIQQTILFLICILLTASCTEVIQLDLRSADKQLVIEGSVSTLKGTVIKMTQSINFQQQNSFPPIENANVEVTDNLGNTVLLDEVEAGTYSSSDFIGIEGRTYSLTVKTENETLSAQCQLPQKVMFKELIIEEDFSTNFWGKSSDTLTHKITVTFDDPAGTDNFYNFIEYINEEQVSTYYTSDKSQDGVEIEKVLLNKDRYLKSGDILRIEMQCITEEIYDYLKNLTGSETERQSSTPSNPLNNIEGAELGYFSAHSSEFKSLVIQ